MSYLRTSYTRVYHDIKRFELTYNAYGPYYKPHGFSILRPYTPLLTNRSSIFTINYIVNWSQNPAPIKKAEANAPAQSLFAYAIPVANYPPATPACARPQYPSAPTTSIA